MASPPIDVEALPFLPGFRYPVVKPAYHRPQIWAYVNGQRMDTHGIDNPHDKQKFVRAVKHADSWRSGSVPDSTTREVFKGGVKPRDFDELPAWDALDRHVLRFYGSFKEAVVETNIENYRNRKCVIYFYLEDDTCCIAEPRTDNSGIPQGNLIRRHRFPAPTSGYLRAEDLRVGENIHVYGKSIRVTNCDDFTRDYYASLGIEQAPALQEEVDSFEATRAAPAKKPTHPRTYEQVYRESRLGGGHINADMQQFMEKDRQVCRFFAVLDDLSTPQYERRPFELNYFLADDQMEIREKYPLNCGRDNFPVFRKKSKIPKFNQLRGPMDMPLKKEDYVSITDLGVGLDVTLAGQQYHVYDADAFTRSYFERELGIVLEPKQDVRLPERAVPRAPTPPYTGYGTADDSMGSVLALCPNKPKKDQVKLYDNDGKILRFSARLKDARPEDTERRFLVMFYLADDCIGIHEPPQRNLGIVTGRYLEKGVHLNQVTGRLFEPADLLPGKIIKINGHELEMLEMDEYTRKYAVSEGMTGTANLAAVLEKIREGMRQQFPSMRDTFRRFDLDRNSVITLDEFKLAIHKFGFHLTEPEVLVLMRHFDRRQDGQISYNEFCDAVLDEDFTTDMCSTSKPALDTAADAGYEERVAGKTEQRAETEKVRKAVREIGDVVYKFAGKMRKLMKEFTHMTHKQHVTCEQIQEALTRIGHHFDLEDVQRCIVYITKEENLDEVDYVAFIKAIVASFHDMAPGR